jgi:hypothetical protein
MEWNFFPAEPKCIYLTKIFDTSSECCSTSEKILYEATWLVVLGCHVPDALLIPQVV